MRIAMVGHGFVGKSLTSFLGKVHDICVYDKYCSPFSSSSRKLVINSCDLAFIAVPTPSDAVTGACDLSEIRDVAEWIRIPVCIKSTVPPGTTDSFSKQTSLPTTFSPEYIGERPGHAWQSPISCGFLIVGGNSETCDRVNLAYQEASTVPLSYIKTNAAAAELCKYMENCFLATKVCFVNQFFDIAAAFGVGFEDLRKLWLLDPRIGESHSSVLYPRGFGGKCLPKDLRALIASAKYSSDVSFLEAIYEYNKRLRDLPSNSAGTDVAGEDTERVTSGDWMGT
jgi:UDPglucose 6-dehydrogenase